MRTGWSLNKSQQTDEKRNYAQDVAQTVASNLVAHQSAGNERRQHWEDSKFINELFATH